MTRHVFIINLQSFELSYSPLVNSIAPTHHLILPGRNFLTAKKWPLSTRNGLIRLQRIYNFWLFHAIILSVLGVLYALIWYFILFLGLTYQPRAQCQFLLFPCFWVLQKRNIKWSPNGIKRSRWFFLDQKTHRRVGEEARRPMGRPQALGARP